MAVADSLMDLYAVHLGQLQALYQTVLSDRPWAAVVIDSGCPVPVFGDDQAYPFRVNPRFRQWVPEGDYSHSLIVIRPGARPLLICHQPQDYWHATPAPPDGSWADCFDVVCVSTPEDAGRALPDRDENWAFLGDPPSCPDGFSSQALNPPDLTSALDYHRVHKTDFEVECLRRANRVAARGHLAARSAFEEGASELEIHLAYLSASRQMERQLPYPNIVALNEHGCILHYDALEPDPPVPVRSLLIDAGADYLGYAADITRTHSASRDEFAGLIELVDTAQQALTARISVGVSYVDLHLEMHRLIGTVLADAGLVAMSPESMVEQGVTSAFFPHGLGHHLGLQVHDVGGKLADEHGVCIEQPEGHPFLRNLRPVELGDVFTVEPGLYFIPQLLGPLRAGSCGRQVNWERVNALRAFGGIRIEDDVHVTADGVENLTRDAFQSLVP